MADVPGTLFVVATPIGNLEDVTFRALRTLREVDLIAAEDTRRTSKLLARHEIQKPLISLREHNEKRETPRLVARLRTGASIALVSDAGTPGISDPGAGLVRATREAGLRVVPVPGPSAITAALSASGIPAGRFLFLGFPPPSGKARQDWFRSLADEPGPVVFFESPHRIRRTLVDLTSIERPILIQRELTKINETLVMWPNQSPVESIPEIGEFTVVVFPTEPKAADVSDSAVYSLYSNLTAGVPLETGQALQICAVAHDISIEQATKIVKKASILAKQQNRHRP